MQIRVLQNEVGEHWGMEDAEDDTWMKEINRRGYEIVRHNVIESRQGP